MKTYTIQENRDTVVSFALFLRSISNNKGFWYNKSLLLN